MCQNMKNNITLVKVFVKVELTKPIFNLDTQSHCCLNLNLQNVHGVLPLTSIDEMIASYQPLNQ